MFMVKDVFVCVNIGQILKTSKLGNKFVAPSVSVANHWSIKVMSMMVINC